MAITFLFWLSVGLILYTYAGYPAGLFLLARLKPHPHFVDPRTTPSVTLLIAAYNEETSIARKLVNSLNLDYPPDKLQILVAADGSDDHTVPIVQSYHSRQVELSYQPERAGKMAAINRAMPRASGQIVVFSDANNEYDQQAIRALVRPFSDPDVGMVTGAKRIIQEGDNLSQSEGLYWKYESFIKEQETRLSCVIGAAGEIMAIRRDLFHPPPTSVINDDFYMAAQVIRQGYRVVYTPQAQSYERTSYSTGDEMNRRARIVAGRYQLMSYALRLLDWRRPFVIWQMISHKFLRPLIPFAMIAAVVTNILAVLWPVSKVHLHLFLGLLGGQLLFYGLAVVGHHVQGLPVLTRLLYLPVFLVRSNMAALTGLYRYMLGQQTAIWDRVQRREGQISHDQS